MKKFAVSCYSSPIHSWWFSSHPPPAPTARTEAPRFTIPAMKRERQEKRPFVYLARLLNSMTGEEWENYGLDPKVTAIKIQNIQLAKIGVSEPLDPLEDVQDGGVTAAVHGQEDVQGGCVTQDQDDEVCSVMGQDVGATIDKCNVGHYTHGGSVKPCSSSRPGGCPSPSSPAQNNYQSPPISKVLLTQHFRQINAHKNYRKAPFILTLLSRNSLKVMVVLKEMVKTTAWQVLVVLTGLM